MVPATESAGYRRSMSLRNRYRLLSQHWTEKAAGVFNSSALAPARPREDAARPVPGKDSASSDFHFIEDYERHVDDLIRSYPLAEAMSLAVGGHYEDFATILAEVLVQTGLTDGMSLVDLGCGSGRAAKGVSERVDIEYLGTDVVERLLEYAATVCPQHYRFKLHRELSVPAPDSSADMVCAFSLFTHLLHEESYVYLQESQRVLKPGGQLVMSFLEFADAQHWTVFETTVAASRNNARQPLNMFIERGVIDVWCAHLGFTREAFIDASDTRWNGKALGQSIVVLRKP